MSLRYFFAAALLAGLANQTFAEMETTLIAPSQSARISGSGFYCCSPENMTLDPATINIKRCKVQGGYCMGNQHVGAWIFDVPQLHPETTFSSIRFTGNREAGSSAWGNVMYRWIGDESLSTNSASVTLYSPDASTSNYWGGSTTFNHAVPSSLFDLPMGGRLMVIAYNGTDNTVTLLNDSSSTPTLELTFEEPATPCHGDVDGDELVGVNDLLSLLNIYGNFCPPPCNQDVTGDGSVDIEDLLTVISRWGSSCEHPGACCLPDGSCAATDAIGCQDAGGTWNGTGTFCDYVACPQLGACCLEDDSCQVLLPNACENAGGDYAGADTNCSSVDCTIPALNDECIDAHVVSNGSFDFSITEATDSTDPYSYDCEIPGYFGWMEQDLWWSYEATCTGTLTANLCDAVEFNADIVVYEGTCQNMTQIACNGHYPNDGWEQCYLGSRVDTQVTAGTMYLIRVGFDGVQYPHEDNGTLTIDCTP
jgi:hypothetical protein